MSHANRTFSANYNICFGDSGCIQTVQLRDRAHRREQQEVTSPALRSRSQRKCPSIQPGILFIRHRRRTVFSDRLPVVRPISLKHPKQSIPAFVYETRSPAPASIKISAALRFFIFYRHCPWHASSHASYSHLAGFDR
jgi:hypothetical protein